MNHIQLFEVASGVTYLHGFGIAHGDLKGVIPTNSTHVMPTDK